MTDDARLLRRYSAEGCEAAFSELVERFLPLVYSAALRQVGGNRQMAESYYLDGVLRNRIVLPGCLANTVNDAAISIGGFPTSPFKGCIDEIHLFDRELTAKEVKGLSRLSESTAISYALFNQRVLRR